MPDIPGTFNSKGIYCPKIGRNSTRKTWKNKAKLQLEQKRRPKATVVDFEDMRNAEKVAGAWGFKPGTWLLVVSDEEMLMLSPFETKQHVFMGPRVSQRLLRSRGWLI